MNPCMPDWDFAGEVPVSNQMKSTGQAHELVELLWQNGEVVLHSQTQTQRKPNEPRNIQNQTIRGTGSNGNSNNLIQDDETVSWIQSPLEDPFEKEFYSHFFSELPPSALEVHKQTGQLGEEKMIKFDSPSVVTNLQQSNVNHSAVSGLQKNSMPPPRFESQDAAQQTRSFGELGKVVNFSHFAAPFMAEIGSCSGQFDQECSQNFTQGEVRNCSMMTVGSSHCDSNQVVYDLDMSRASSNGMGTTARSSGNLKDDVQKGIAQNGRGKIETLEPTVTSSSGGSGSSFNRTSKQSTGDNSLKRKSRDAGESECQSEATEFESGAGNKTAQRSGSCRKSRAAEVHNLSERRRRDRINERMRALQELIPHCNKTDKASMLDEAIEYLKSLQLQLQMMWMGSGMAPMMFPGVHHYISRMGMGMGPPSLPSVPNSMHFSRVPLGGQTMSMAQAQNQAVNALCQTSLSNPVNYQNQMQNPKFSDQYARYMGFHPMQANSQPTNMFRFGSPALQSHVLSPPSSGCGTFTGGAAATDNAALSGKMG